jgi:predicted TPR repeat methyltransferase
MTLQASAPFGGPERTSEGEIGERRGPRPELQFARARAAELRLAGLRSWRDGACEEAQRLLAAAAACVRDPKILAELGCVERLLGKRAEAMQCFLESLQLDPSRLQVWLNAASLCVEAGDKSAAEEAYLQALALDSACAEAATGLAMLRIERGDYREAARLLSIAIAGGGASAPIFACLGQARYLLGEFEASSIAFAEAAQLAPTDVTNTRRYARARLIDATLQGEPELGLDEYSRIAGAHAEDIATVGAGAFQALVGFERREAAIALGQALLRRAPGDAILAFHLDALQERPLQRAPDAYLTASFDRYAPQFDKHLVETLGYDVPAKMHALLVELQPRFSHILDLGCGTGLAARYLSSLHGTLTGLDISPGMLTKAGQRNQYDRLIQAEGVSYLSQCAESYDLIVAFDLVVYIGDLEALFAAVAARLSPGGVFAFSYETQDGAGYRLHHAGRFAHAPSYIDALAAGRFKLEVSMLTTLRLEANRSVDGRLALLRKI